MRPGLAVAVRMVLLLAFALLAGCVAPPDSGPIRPGMAGPVAGPPEPLVRPIANPPREGMQPTQIVAGFLAATAAIGENFEVARQYLTADASAAWDPGAGVSVFQGEAPTLAASGTTVTAEYLSVGAVSPAGVATDTDPTPGSSVFTLETQADGQWRIAATPPGLLLSRAAFARAFATGHAFFIDPSGRWAVPDARAVPRTGPQALATALLNALLAGPSPWLEASVATAIPESLQLALGAVPVTDGVARVELTGPVPLLDDAAATRFGAQLAWTLRQVPQVEAFEVYFGGSLLPLTGSRGPVPLTTYNSFVPDVLQGRSTLYGLSPAGEPVEVSAGEPGPLPTDAGLAAGLGAPLVSIAVSPTGGLLAGAAADRTGVLIGRVRQPVQVVSGAPVSGPAIDGLDRVWWTDSQGQVIVAVPDPQGRYVAAVVPVDAPGPVRAVRPAREGARALLIIGDGARVHLAAIVADESGVQLRGAVPLGPQRPAAAIAWHSAVEVTLVLPGADVVERIDLLGGTRGAFAVPVGIQSVTDAPADPLVLGLPDATAGPLSGSGVRAIPGLTAPAYPG